MLEMTIGYYIKKVKDTILLWGKRIEAAPVKAYGKDIFGNRKQAQWQLKKERAEALKNIAEEAAMFGFDLSTEFQNWKSMTAKVEEPEE